MAKCRHLVASEEAYRIEPDGRETPATVPLCAWADSAPPQLLNAPRWMQRNALGGHLWRDGDCEGCPCADSGEPSKPRWKFRGGPGLDWPCSDHMVVECAKSECQRLKRCALVG